MKEKYTKESLEPIVKSSVSIVEVLRKLNIADNGGNRTTIKKFIKLYNLSSSHFTGRRHLLGKHSPNRKTWKEILVNNKKEHSHVLRRALIESGRDYICEICKAEPFWKNKELRLQVDHINGIKKDNTSQNLRFLCPNCHSQTSNFCGSMGFTDITSVIRYDRHYGKIRHEKRN